MAVEVAEENEAVVFVKLLDESFGRVDCRVEFLWLHLGYFARVLPPPVKVASH